MVANMRSSGVRTSTSSSGSPLSIIAFNSGADSWRMGMFTSRVCMYACAFVVHGSRRHVRSRRLFWQSAALPRSPAVLLQAPTELIRSSAALLQLSAVLLRSSAVLLRLSAVLLRSSAVLLPSSGVPLRFSEVAAMGLGIRDLRGFGGSDL